MEGYNDTRPASPRFQNILDAVDTSISIDPNQNLGAGNQQSIDDDVVLGPRPFRCDGTNCGPIKQVQKKTAIDLPPELNTGKFMCICQEWIPLQDEFGFTLTPWLNHLLTCGKPQQQVDASMDVAAVASALQNLGDESTSVGPSIEEPRQSGGGLASEHQTGPSDPFEIISTLSFPVVGSGVPQGTTESRIPPQITIAEGQSQADTSYFGVERRSIDIRVEDPSPKPSGPDVLPRKKRKANRTEAQRICEFLADPLVAEIEAYRVLCAACNKWIKLRNNSRYCSIPWQCHKASCLGNAANPTSAHSQLFATPGPSRMRVTKQETEQAEPSPSYPPPMSQNIEVAEQSNPTEAWNDPQQSLLISPSSAHLSLQLQLHVKTAPPELEVIMSHRTTPPPTRVRLMDEQSRRALLVADPHAEIIEPSRIFCSVCKKWVKLRSNSTYCSAPWKTHIRRCIFNHKQKACVAVKAVISMPAPDKDVPPGSTLNQGKSSDKSQADYPRGSIEDNENMTCEPSKKRRGRPPKTHVPTRSGEASDSEMSYESEET